MNLQPLQPNDRAMIRQVCSIKSEDMATVRTSELLVKLELEDLDHILRERRLRRFGHVEPSSGAVRTACYIQIDGRRGTGRPRLTWKAQAYIVRPVVREVSLRTFVIWTLSYTVYRCTDYIQQFSCVCHSNFSAPKRV